MVNGGDNVEFQFPIGRGREHTSVNFDFFSTTAIQSAKSGEDTGLFACAAGAIEEEMGKIGGRSLEERECVSQSHFGRFNARTIEGHYQRG